MGAMGDAAQRPCTWFHCPSCGRDVKCAPGAAGQVETCPYCGARGEVAAEPPAPAPGTPLPAAAEALFCALAGIVIPVLAPIGAIVLSRQAQAAHARWPDRYVGIRNAHTAEIMGWILLARDAVAAVIVWLVWRG